MLFHVAFAVFLIFELSETILWSPCPALRSTFQDIYIDSHGRKRPNCVCKNDLFGEQCQFKVYVAFDGKQNGVKKNLHQPEHSIYPIKYLQLNYYPNSSLVITWRHAKTVDVQYYVIQFRELTEDLVKPWRTLAYIRSEYLNKQDLMLFEMRDFYNYTMYEMNLGIFSNDDVIVSVSVLHDGWRAESHQDVQLHDVMFSATVTWSAWSEWGSCDTQHGCGKGKQKRSRVLVTNQCLSNKSEESRLCKLKSCPVNGAWSVWSVWSQCSVACGNGTRSRLRSCTSPTPRHGGEMCHGIRHMNETCINEACREISDNATWSPLEKLKSLEFTSVVLGAAAGFTTCLLLTACPYLLKRWARTLREKYKSCQDEKIPKLLPFTQQQSPLNPPLPPPLPPPPPAVPAVLAAWRQPGHQMEMANNVFMDELLKAFKTFNFDANKQFGKSSDKPP